MAQVESMIERCLHLYMNQEEVIMALQLQADISSDITRQGIVIHASFMASATALTYWDGKCGKGWSPGIVNSSELTTSD